MKNSPSPSRLRLDTSPPEGGEEGRELVDEATLPRPLQGQHAGSTYDRRRDAFMRSRGYSTLRFWNSDVLKQRTSFRETILAAIDGRVAENVGTFDLRLVFAPSEPAHTDLTP